MVQWEAQTVHQSGSRIWQIMFKSLPHGTGFEGMKGSCREAGWQGHWSPWREAKRCQWKVHSQLQWRSQDIGDARTVKSTKGSSRCEIELVLVNYVYCGWQSWRNIYTKAFCSQNIMSDSLMSNIELQDLIYTDRLWFCLMCLFLFSGSSLLE